MVVLDLEQYVMKMKSLDSGAKMNLNPSFAAYLL